MAAQDASTKGVTLAHGDCPYPSGLGGQIHASGVQMPEKSDSALIVSGIRHHLFSQESGGFSRLFHSLFENSFLVTNNHDIRHTVIDFYDSIDMG
jgi:hypothetical protein